MGLGSDVVALPVVEFRVVASVYPPQDLFINSTQTSMEYAYKACVTRLFVFDGSNILSLKSKAASATVPNIPTRVEVVSALIWKCAIEASRSNLCFTRPAMLFQVTNMWKVLGHPTLMGNIVGAFAVKTEESEANLQSLVAILREGIEKFKVRYGNGVISDDICALYKEYGNLMRKDDIDKYSCTSWCRFGFYEANFGWGKPSWVTVPSLVVKNIIILIDTIDGEGIEAILSFTEEDMDIIEINKELLTYAYLDPIVI